MRRRDLATLMGAPLLPGLQAMAAPVRSGWIAQPQQMRVIVDNDFAGDPDGLVALAHQWLSPGARTVLVTTSALDAKLAALAGEPAGRTAQHGQALALELAALARLAAPCPVVAGAESPGVGAEQVSAAARAIVAEARREDALPLVLTCGGPLTNVAAALRLAPDIAARMTLVWIGGSLSADGGAEYNLATDREAARQVLLDPTLTRHVVPRETYRQLKMSVAELRTELRPISALARWLHDRYLQLPPFVQLGPTVTLGDSALLAAALLDRDAPRRRVPASTLLGPAGLPTTDPGGEVLLIERVDARAVVADLLAQLKLNVDPERPR